MRIPCACLLLLFLFDLPVTRAQETPEKRGYIGVALGPSIPFSDFASTSADNDDAGFALNGSNLSISFNYRIGNNLGVAAMLTGTDNPLDEAALENAFRKNWPQANWTVISENWRLGGLMIGGFATFPAGDRFAFDTRILIGGLNFTSPQINATATNGGISVYGTRESKTVNTGVFDLGFIFRYNVNSAVCLTGNFDFISANPRFENVTTTTTFGSSTSSFDQSYNTLNLTLGIGFLLR